MCGYFFVRFAASIVDDCDVNVVVTEEDGVLTDGAEKGTSGDYVWDIKLFQSAFDGVESVIECIYLFPAKKGRFRALWYYRWHIKYLYRYQIISY